MKNYTIEKNMGEQLKEESTNEHLSALYFEANPSEAPEYANDFRTLAEIIKDARKGHGWTQREFAAKLGITQASLCLMERSDKVKARRPTKRVVRALRPYVDIPFEQLVAMADYDLKEFEETKQPEDTLAEATLKEFQQLSPEDICTFSGIFDIMRDEKNKRAMAYVMELLRSITEGPANPSYEHSIWTRDLILGLYK